MRLKGNALVAQSGGPTAVINNSLCGVIQEWLRQEGPGTLYGGVSGVKGILAEEFIDLSRQDPDDIAALRYTPGAAIHSCRHKVTDEDLEKLLAICRKHDIRYFFYNGGNDSMDTCNRMYEAAAASGYEMHVLGVPKTVDNDLPLTDHCPGYGSAAKYLAVTALETAIDLECVSTKNKVTIMECMGRNAGWLTAAAVLARRSADDAPHLVYLPERAFSMTDFLADVERVYQKIGHVFIAASEGLVDRDGNYISAGGSVDSFGHAQLSGVGEMLKQTIERELGIKTRCNTLGTAQRSAAHFMSKTDADEAYLAGVQAVRYALEGQSGVMVALQRQPGAEYSCTTVPVALGKVANVEHKLPLEWITEAGNDVTEDFVRYAAPLIAGEVAVPCKNGIPDYRKLNFQLK